MQLSGNSTLGCRLYSHVSFLYSCVHSRFLSDAIWISTFRLGIPRFPLRQESQEPVGLVMVADIFRSDLDIGMYLFCMFHRHINLLSRTPSGFASLL